MADDNKKGTKNNRNPDSLLFRRLTRLLSGPLVNYRTQTGRRLRRIDLDKYSSRFTSAAGHTFKRSSYDPFENISVGIMDTQHRQERYVDFDQMEYTPEIASTLDIYADEMTTHSQLQPILKVDCPNEEIQSILESLYYNILNIEFNLFGWCRTMCKYGDFFLYLDIDEARGIQSVIGLPSSDIERLEGEDKTNPNYVQFQWNSAGMTFENWQVAHFRILGNDKHAPYGTSALEASRRIWRQLTLLEDAMMAYRIVRSPERRAFYIDVGNIPPEEVEQYMQKVMSQMKRHQVVDPSTGRVDLRYNPLSIEEDYFIPVRGQSSTKIDSVKGGQYTGDIDDVKYLRDKLFSALKIPQSYLSRGEGAEEDKTTLAQKDIRFARTIQRLQRSVTTELEKIGIIHLYVLGFRDDDLLSFKVHLSNPSKIAELQELEHWKTKFDTAGSATEGYFSKRWVAKNMLGISDETFQRMQREMFYDRLFEASLETASEEQAEAGTGGGAGDAIGGGDLGGMPPVPGAEGGEAGGGDAGADMGGGEDMGGAEDMGGGAPPAEDEGALLAEPGNRDPEDWYKLKNRKGETSTPASKGKWYKPTHGDARKGRGPRVRKRNGMWSKELSSSTARNVLPKGAQELFSLSKVLYEEEVSNYNREEEKKIFDINQDIRGLLKELKLRDKDET